MLSQSSWKIVMASLFFATSAGVVTCPLFAASGGDAGEPVLLAEMDPMEPYPAMLHHAGYLWVGQSRKDFDLGYRVTIFNQEDHRIHEIPLKHSVGTMHAHGPDAIVVTGTAANPNLTAWSVIRVKDGRFSTEHHWIPAEAWASGWLGVLGGKNYFLDIGGNVNDPDGAFDPNLPAQTVFTMAPGGGRPSYSKHRLRGPLNGFLLGNQFVIQRKNDIGSSESMVVSFDPLTGASKPLFNRALEYAGEPVSMGDGTRVAVAGSGQVHVANVATGEVVSFETGGTPRSVVAAGNCVVVGMEQEKKGLVLRVVPGAPIEMVDTFDFNSFGDRLRGLRRVAFDASRGRIYGQSVYACNPITTDCSKSWNAVVATPRGTSAAIAEKCRN